jgi:hypothetical protein
MQANELNSTTESDLCLYDLNEYGSVKATLQMPGTSLPL